MMANSKYVRFEVLRTWRSRRYLLFSLGFPLVLFLVVAGPNRNAHLDGITFPLYYMTGMTAWGAMVAVVSSGGRIAAERSVGWTRQLRITPLRTSTYFSAKVLSGYLVALLSIAVLFLAGSAVGVRLSAGEWSKTAGLLLVGLIPFAVLGILLGHLVKVDSLGPALGGTTSLFALLGGAYGPLVSSGVFFSLVKCLPSYWLVQAAKSALGAGGWPPAEAWIVIAAWTLVLTWLARLAYARDTARV
jgi:ABC-2 type transport system permease protein